MARPRRRWLRPTLAVGGLALVGSLLAAGAAATCRPSWYQPRSPDYTRLQDDKRTQLRIENEISAALNRGEPIEIELTQEQVNRWIAARDELWPGEAPSLEPFSRPQVIFRKGNRVRAAALCQVATLTPVVSVDLTVSLTKDGVLISWESAHAGLLPAPVGLIDRAIRSAAGRWGTKGVSFLDSAILLPSESSWPNGDRRFRVAGISIDDDVLRLRLIPA